jgi:hypothetical protein
VAGLIPRVLPSNAVHFPSRSALGSFTCRTPPLPPLSQRGDESKIEILGGSFFLFVLLDNASDMCPDPLYVAFAKHLHGFFGKSGECNPSRAGPPG